MATTRGRQLVLPLTNKSGGAVANGDVVIVDSANDTAFTTTTSGRYEGIVGIAQEAIANNSTGRVLLQGYAGLINVPASVTRGHYIETHTVAKQATGNSTRRSGSFGVFLTGGTTPTAVIGIIPDQTASGSGGVTEHSYVERTTDLSVTATSDATAQTFISSAAVAYDGSTRVKIECWSPIFSPAASQALVGNLYDGATDLGEIVDVFSGQAPAYGVRYLTPTAATHTYHFKVWKTSGTATAHAGAGGTATLMPAFIRITTA